MIELILLTGLATWRLSSLLVRESGPFEMFSKIRDWSGVKFDEHSRCIGDTVVSQAFCCLWCMSIWIAIFPAFYLSLSHNHNITYFVAMWLGTSGAAILFDSLIFRPPSI